MEDNDRTRNDEGPNWGTKDQSGNAILKYFLSGLLASFLFLDRDNRTESDMEIDQSEPSDQNSPADHELGPKRINMDQPNRGRNPSGKKYRSNLATHDGKV